MCESDVSMNYYWWKNLWDLKWAKAFMLSTAREDDDDLKFPRSQALYPAEEQFSAA
jgi:hypothetical protein